MLFFENEEKTLITRIYIDHLLQDDQQIASALYIDVFTTHIQVKPVWRVEFTNIVCHAKQDATTIFCQIALDDSYETVNVQFKSNEKSIQELFHALNEGALRNDDFLGDFENEECIHRDILPIVEPKRKKRKSNYHDLFESLK